MKTPCNEISSFMYLRVVKRSMHIKVASSFKIARQHGPSHMLGHGAQRRIFMCADGIFPCCVPNCLELKQAEAAPLNVDGVDAEKAAVNPRRAVLEAGVRRQARHDQEDLEEYTTRHRTQLPCMRNPTSGSKKSTTIVK
jgi:hypothetical protein